MEKRKPVICVSGSCGRSGGCPIVGRHEEKLYATLLALVKSSGDDPVSLPKRCQHVCTSSLNVPLVEGFSPGEMCQWTISSQWSIPDTAGKGGTYILSGYFVVTQGFKFSATSAMTLRHSASLK
jgi:hypothetical protein